MTNRLSTVSYDAAGNVSGIGVHALQYDAENRLLSWDGATKAYAYDGEGRRVKMTTPGGTTVYVYDAAGQLAAEYMVSGQAPQAPCTTCYLATDHLGSTRLITDADGTAKQRIDYLPFGEEVTGAVNGRSGIAGYAADARVEQKFTGKERDAGTGLDYFGARYFSGAQGRMTSPDAYGIDQHPEDPQSWNLYSYGRNNPLRFVDPTGEYVCGSGVDEKKCNNFQTALDAAQGAANKLKETYGEQSKQYTDAQRAIDVYGKQNIDNGVTITLCNNPIAEGEVPPTVGTTAKTPDNPLGQKITAAFAANVFSGDHSGNAGTVAHEGSHLADESDWVRSGLSPAHESHAHSD